MSSGPTYLPPVSDRAHSYVPKKEQAASNAAAADGIADFTDFPDACKAYVAMYRTARDVNTHSGEIDKRLPGQRLDRRLYFHRGRCSRDVTIGPLMSALSQGHKTQCSKRRLFDQFVRDAEQAG